MFAVRKPSTGEIIATSANQIALPKFQIPQGRYKNVDGHWTPFPLGVLKGGPDETKWKITL